MDKTWTGLDPDDLHNLLVSLIGYRFGARPEERIDEIRMERAAYARGFVKLAGVRKTDRVLDLGSGCGFGTAEIARRARSVLACDISPAYLEFARAECEAHRNVEFLQVESRDLSLVPAESIDAVISMSVFIHLNLYDIACYFAEFARILRPGGRVAFDFADANRLFSRFRSHGHDALFREHAGYYREDAASLPKLLQWNSARGITAVARDAGFRRVARRGHRLLFQR